MSNENTPKDPHLIENVLYWTFKNPQPAGFLEYVSKIEKVIVDHRALLFSGGIRLIGKFWIFYSFALF